MEEVVDWLRRRGTAYAEATIRTHVTSSMCVDAPANHGTVYADLKRISEGRYALNR